MNEMKIEREIIALLSKKALKNFNEYQDKREEHGEEPESIDGWVSRLVADHQKQFPAGWQRWCKKEKAEAMSRIAEAALREKEFMVGRVITLYA